MNHPTPNSTNLVAPSQAAITRICGQRDQAIGLATRAVGMLEQAHDLMHQASRKAREASAGTVFRGRDRGGEENYRRLFLAFDPEASLSAFKHDTDAAIWTHLHAVTGMKDLMDAKDLKEWDEQLASADGPIEVTEANVLSSLRGFIQDAPKTFRRGVAEAFSALDRRFRSHDGFKRGSRLIFTGVISSFGTYSSASEQARALRDVVRIFQVLDGEVPNPDEVRDAITEELKGTFGPKQFYLETPYFRIRGFKKGTVHLWMRRDDLVRRVNLLLAEHYGEVLADAVPHESNPEVTTALCKHLAFYASPPKVVAKVLWNVYLHDGPRILEPSAGEGAIVDGVLACLPGLRKRAAWRECEFTEPRIDVVEVDPRRVGILATKYRGQPGVLVRQANFLKLTPVPEYDWVLMNPPFAGTHWQDHIRHAFQFLAPGGRLVAVVPSSYEFREDKKSQAFRAWAKEHAWSYQSEEDLPLGSFKESGTNVNTMILRLCAKS
jgi:hypothetical protein